MNRPSRVFVTHLQGSCARASFRRLLQQFAADLPASCASIALKINLCDDPEFHGHAKHLSKPLELS
jgi:hypothetical protein